MNKKGIFITLTAVIILIILTFLIIENSEQSTELSNINIEYKKQKIMSDYINDIEDLYLPSIISYSEKYSLEGISDYVNENDCSNKIDIALNLSNIIVTGNLTQTIQIINYEKTLPALIENSFNTKTGEVFFNHLIFNITSVKHIDNWTIEVNSTVNFSITSKIRTFHEINNITWRNIHNYSTELSVNGFVDPKEHERIIRIFWKSNISIDCFLKKIDSDYDCGTIAGICPPSGCMS